MTAGLKIVINIIMLIFRVYLFYMHTSQMKLLTHHFTTFHFQFGRDLFECKDFIIILLFGIVTVPSLFVDGN